MIDLLDLGFHLRQVKPVLREHVLQALFCRSNVLCGQWLSKAQPGSADQEITLEALGNPTHLHKTHEVGGVSDETENDSGLLFLQLSLQIAEQAGGIEILKALAYFGLIQRLTLFLGDLRLEIRNIHAGIRLEADLQHRSSPGRTVRGAAGHGTEKTGEDRSEPSQARPARAQRQNGSSHVPSPELNLRRFHSPVVSVAEATKNRRLFHPS